ncbi:MAG: hypothetical protein E6917_03805 [Clostridium botulinum]|nr:hypothetical protein [Clostridium botulinum]
MKESPAPVVSIESILKAVQNELSSLSTHKAPLEPQVDITPSFGEYLLYKNFAASS